MFVQHVQATVFDLHEPRTLQGLFIDYKNILSEFGQEVNAIKTSFIKSILENKFDDSIGFHDRFQKNESTLVFDATRCGSFLESAIICWGLSPEQLMKNVALQIKEKAKHLQQMQWPPTIEEACEKMDDNLLTEFVSWLRSPNPNEVKDLPKVYAIASLLQSFITVIRYRKKDKFPSATYEYNLWTKKKPRTCCCNEENGHIIS